METNIEKRTKSIKKIQKRVFKQSGKKNRQWDEMWEIGCAIPFGQSRLKADF